MDVALEDAILVSLAILGLDSGGRLGCGSLGEELCVTDTEPADAGWCYVQRKEFEQCLLNKLCEAIHILLYLVPTGPQNWKGYMPS